MMKGYNLFSVSLDSTDIQTQLRLAFFEGPTVLFMEPASTEKRKSNFKTESNDIIHTLKNYFVTMFSVFSFQQ